MEDVVETTQVLTDIQDQDMESSNAEEEFLNEDLDIGVPTAETTANGEFVYAMSSLICEIG